MAEPPRPTAQRVADTLGHLMAEEADVWVATASVSPEGVPQPYVVPLSLGWIDDRVVIAIETRSRTAKNLAATGRARLGLGPTRDVSMIDVEVEQVVDANEVDADLADRYADQTKWEPRREPVPMVYVVLRPTRVQAWREANELKDRTLMRTVSGWPEDAPSARSRIRRRVDQVDELRQLARPERAEDPEP